MVNAAHPGNRAGPLVLGGITWGS